MFAVFFFVEMQCGVFFQKNFTIPIRSALHFYEYEN